MSIPADNRDAAGLEQSPELLQHLLEQSDLLVLVVDGEDRILLFNRECEKLTGYRADEVIGQTVWSTVIPEDEADSVRGMATRLRNDGGTAGFTNHWRTRDGDIHLVRWHNTLFHDQADCGYCVLSTGIDITAEDEARRAHRTTEHELRALVDALPVLVAHLDGSYRIRFANHGYRDWFGLDPERQKGKHVRDVIGHKAFAVLRPRFEQALAGEQATYYGEVPYARGGTRFIHGTYIPSHDHAGSVDGLYILSVDLREQERLRRQLTDETRRYRAVVDHAIDAIVTIDEQGSIESFNPAAERLFGYRASEVIGWNVNILMPEPDRSRHDDYLRHYLETGERRIIGTGREVTGRRRDGSKVELSLAITEFFDSDRRQFVGFLHDISARKQAEREARQSLGEMAHYNRLAAMGELTSGLAHELSQPLTAVHGMAEAGLNMIERDTADPGQLRKAFSQIARQSQRAGEVISQFRAFLRKDRYEEYALHDPDTLMEEVLELIWHEIEGRGIRVKQAMRAEGECIEINRVQIQQVLLNLVKNAIDAMDEVDGNRVLDLESVCDNTANACRLSIADTGPGIAEHHIEKLFHPFFTTKDDGLGQGLPICRSIVEAHGGSLKFENRRGGGALFTVTLPLRQEGRES